MIDFKNIFKTYNDIVSAIEIAMAKSDLRLKLEDSSFGYFGIDEKNDAEKIRHFGMFADITNIDAFEDKIVIQIRGFTTTTQDYEQGTISVSEKDLLDLLSEFKAQNNADNAETVQIKII